MSQMVEVQKKGLDRCWLEDSLSPEYLHLHISQIPAGTRAHPPHAHSGAEAFYVLEGSGAVETESGTIAVTANQAVILDASRLHGLVNTGDGPLKYIVIIAKP
jgi:mannose-6-phosphate isomerase-like protein (cupin superfamily)